MHLKNKQSGLTGKLTFLDFDIVVSETEIDLTILLDNSDGECIDRQFYSLAELKSFLEDWEDYKPAEPLIKDEKIRKAVRAWAEVNGDTKLYYNRPTIEICINNKAGYVIRSIKFKAEFRKAIDIESGYYTIAELCGDEEEK
jgi:hypothetical protein